MAPMPARKRWSLVLGLIPVGILLFGLALYSTGAGHGSYWAAILFYPVQLLITGILYALLDRTFSDTVFVVIWGLLSVAWFPLIALLFTSAYREVRMFGTMLVVLHVFAIGLVLLVW